MIENKIPLVEQLQREVDQLYDELIAKDTLIARYSDEKRELVRENRGLVERNRNLLEMYIRVKAELETLGV